MLQIASDLFRTSIEDTNKNVAWGEDVQLEKVPHVHFFRTYDSDGKRLTATNSVAGHFHNVEVEFQKNGEPAKIIAVGPAMRMVRKRVKGKWTNAPETLPPVLEDNHTHELEYIVSHTVEARQANPAAAQLVGQESQKTAPIPGVMG